MPPAAPSGDAGCDAANAAATPGSIRLLRCRLDHVHQLTARQWPGAPSWSRDSATDFLVASGPGLAGCGGALQDRRDLFDL